MPPDELQDLLARRGLRFSGDTSIWRMWFLFVSYEGESRCLAFLNLRSEAMPEGENGSSQN